ncbi:MAG: hypothetical protein A3F70_00525 [Acidobacteria bacterium RIFCSPLOWO2_12_FULL_67_14]|nr:MAG: hypothetical protein A3H29_12955 [Acidobacteria bacterium RIFCSPLOWO2_02_FULL_67_21]OFW38753.1 MAG: hypothetical protein A3F70_00525 [Acidobacteria bacterium RIFCSPLOWO2_12_FULL_67_14]
MKRFLFLVALVGVVLGMPLAAQQARPDARDMRLLGHQDLQARSAYHPVIRQQGERWIAYVGHHGGEQPNPMTGRPEPNGTSIVDVTNPRAPKYLAHIPGEKGGGEAGGAQMVRVCAGSELPRADRSKFYLLRSAGGSGHEIWDVTNPAQPSRLTVVVSGLTDTHKTWWECDTGIAYLVSGDPKWRTRRMTKIYDLSDPAKPVFVRDFGLPGQQPGSTGPLPADLHGPISLGPKVNRIYFGYGTSRDGTVQIVDREKLLNGPKEPTEANLLYPQISRMDLPRDGGAHTTLPLLGFDLPEFAKQKAPPPTAPLATDPHDHGGAVNLGIPQAHRDFLAVVSESTQNECFEPRQLVRMVDITYETRPMGASTWTVPEASGNFCERGGRFGPHGSHENPTPIYFGRVLFVTFFNAGLRALDIRDPFNPKEIAYFIPAVTEKTDKRCVGTGASERCKVAIQTNNVDVDDRGYIYIVDRANTGMHILELTGPARQVARFPAS